MLSSLYPDAIPAMGAVLGLAMFIILVRRFLANPLLGFAFSMTVIIVAGILALGILKYVVCQWFPGMPACENNQLRASAFAFFSFPLIAEIPWIVLGITSVFRRRTR